MLFNVHFYVIQPLGCDMNFLNKPNMNMNMITGYKSLEAHSKCSCALSYFNQKEVAYNTHFEGIALVTGR